MPRGKHSAAIVAPEPSRLQVRHAIEALTEAATASGFLAASPDTLLSECGRCDPLYEQADACVCALAGADFLAGGAVSPADMETALIEGWIWAPDGRGEGAS